MYSCLCVPLHTLHFLYCVKRERGRDILVGILFVDGGCVNHFTSRLPVARLGRSKLLTLPKDRMIL